MLQGRLVLQKSGFFSALASKINMGLINKDLYAPTKV